MWSDGRNRDATAHHAEAVAICERLGLTDLVAVQAYHGRGEAHFFNLEHHEAIACYRRSIELARSIGDKSYECENLMMVAHAYSGYLGLGDYAQAQAHFAGALEIAERADLEWHIPPTRLGLACVRGHLGDYAGAVADLLDMIRVLERAKLPRYEIMAHEMLASLLLDVGLNEQALEASQHGRAAANAAKINFWRIRAEATDAIARMRLGDLGVGPSLRAALRAARENDERTQMVRCLDGLAELAIRRGEADQCRGIADEMLALATAARMQELAARGRLWRGEALLALGERELAREELSCAASTAEQIGRIRLQIDASEALARGGDQAHHKCAGNPRLESAADVCARLLSTR